MLCLECDGDDLRWLTLAPAIQDESCAGIVTVVSGSLDQKSADMDVAGFGDRSPMLSVTGGVLRGDKPEVGHEFARCGEAIDVIDLTDDGEGGEDLDAAQTRELSLFKMSSAPELQDELFELFSGETKSEYTGRRPGQQIGPRAKCRLRHCRLRFTYLAIQECVHAPQLAL